MVMGVYFYFYAAYFFGSCSSACHQTILQMRMIKNGRPGCVVTAAAAA